MKFVWLICTLETGIDIKSRVLEQWLNLLILKQADTFVYGNHWIYILIRANPGLDRNGQY